MDKSKETAHDRQRRIAFLRERKRKIGWRLQQENFPGKMLGTNAEGSSTKRSCHQVKEVSRIPLAELNIGTPPSVITFNGTVNVSAESTILSNQQGAAEEPSYRRKRRSLILAEKRKSISQPHQEHDDNSSVLSNNPLEENNSLTANSSITSINVNPSLNFNQDTPQVDKECGGGGGSSSIVGLFPFKCIEDEGGGDGCPALSGGASLSGAGDMEENPQKRDKKPTGPSPVKSSTINNNGYTISPPSSTRVYQQSTKYIITTDGININSPQGGYLKPDTREGNNTSNLYPNDQHYTMNNILKSHKKWSKFTKNVHFRTSIFPKFSSLRRRC
ncbi:hypothetical protein PIB30_016414 [Stylosanthes scabra]|uniref:Uncharacterized protein n=1 Tax=Stylosanthes scabra TaxID=79078 RepID=A0ABU6V5L2_9FABA|nr:hypothetical protein [Stylosanthes scabra]